MPMKQVIMVSIVFILAIVGVATTIDVFTSTAVAMGYVAYAAFMLWKNSRRIRYLKYHYGV